MANGALINLIMASRLLYGMANQGILPAPFGRIHHTRRTPYVAIIFTTALAMALATLGDLTDLAGTTTTLLLFIFIAVNAAVLILRSDRVGHCHFVAPTVVLGIAIGFILALPIQRARTTRSTSSTRAGSSCSGSLLFGVNRLVAGRTGTIDPTQLGG